MSVQDDDQANTETPASDGGGTQPVDNTHALLAEVAGTNSTMLQAVVIPFLAVFTALVAGALVLVLTDPELWEIFGSLEWFSACLLYTSPSPRDATLSRMPSSA